MKNGKKKQIFLDWKRQCKNLDLLLIWGVGGIFGRVKNYRLDIVWCYGLIENLNIFHLQIPHNEYLLNKLIVILLPKKHCKNSNKGDNAQKAFHTACSTEAFKFKNYSYHHHQIPQYVLSLL